MEQQLDFKKLAYERKDEYLADLARLIGINSVKNENTGPGAPFGDGVRKALDLMLELGARDGFGTEDVDGYAGVIKLGEGDESLGILAHLDTVPFGKGWKHIPDQLSVEGDYLFGRGVLDDKGPLLAAYYAMKLVKEAGIPLKKEVRLIAGTDEETGMEDMDYYKKHARIPEAGFTPDAEFPAIYAEKGRAEISFEAPSGNLIEHFETDPQVNVVISEANAILNTNIVYKELFDFFLQVTELDGLQQIINGKVHISLHGKAAHAAVPYLGNNAGLQLLNYLASAYKDKIALDFYTLLHDWTGEPLGIYTEGVYMGLLTMNVGRITCDKGQLQVVVDIRYPNDLTIDRIVDIIKTNLKTVDTPIVMNLIEAEKPLFVDPNSELIQELMNSYRDYTGDSFTPAIAIGGGTYAKKFDNFVAFGPVNTLSKPEIELGGCHQPDEGILLDDLLQAIAIYADAIVRLAA